MNEPWEEDLLRHERFLLRLAARLAGPEADAQDLVQDAYVRALERPPRSGAGALRAWLATVVRRSAGRAARSARHRTAREARVARPESQSAVDARLSAHAELLEQLRDLPEGERQALFLRYSEDLTPPEIAARLAVPLETIRTRLRRGRERLRAQLDQRHGRREAWLALLLPVAMRPSSVLPPAAATSASAPPLVAATLTTGVLMGTTAKLVIGAAACATALYLWHWVESPAERSIAALAPAGEGVVAAEESELATAQSEPRREVEAPSKGVADLVTAISLTRPDPGPTAARWPLVVRAVGAPAEGARVRVRARLDAFGRYDPQPLEGVLDATNRIELDVGPHLADLIANAGGARAEELVVELEHPDFVRAEASVLLPDPLDPTVAPAGPLEVEVRVERAALVVGRLVRDDGTPYTESMMVQAHARLGEGVSGEPAGHVRDSQDGLFRLRVDGEGRHAIVALGLGLRPGTAHAVLARGMTVDVGDIVLSRGLVIDGRALDLAGVPAADANVFARLCDAEFVRAAEYTFELPGFFAWKDGAAELLVSEAKTGADGRFELAGLAAQPYELDAHPVGLEAPLPLQKPVVRAPATVELRPLAAEVQLRFVFPEGQARNGHGKWLYFGQEQHFDLHAQDLQESGVKRYALPPEMALGLALDFDGLAPLALELQTPAVGVVAVQEIELVPLATARLTITLRGAPVEDGTPFTALIRSDGKERDQGPSSWSNQLELTELSAGRQRIVLTAGRDRFAPQGHWCDVELEVDLAPGEERHVEALIVRGGTLILEAVSESGERLAAACNVETAEGVALDLVFVARIPQGRAAGENHLFAEAPSRAVPELRPGWYRAEIRAAGYESAVVDVEVRAQAVVERSVVLRRLE